MSTRLRGAVAAGLLLAIGSTRAHGQDAITDRIPLDRLQLVTLGAGAGTITPYQIDPTRLYVLGADYGEFAPGWRLIFRISYWQSRFKESVVQEFVDTLQKNLADPAATNVLLSPVTVYDAAFTIGARRMLSPRSAISPFVSGGIVAHVLNAEGSLIKGTFVEHSLDNIAAGLFAETGLHIRILHRLQIEGSVRADLLSGFRSTQWNAIGSYYFGEPRREAVSK